MTSREERNQRVRIGITGLAFVFLLVLLGTAITGGGKDESASPEEKIIEEAMPANPVDPLGEIAAAPGQAAADEAAKDEAARQGTGEGSTDDVLADELREDLRDGGSAEPPR